MNKFDKFIKAMIDAGMDKEKLEQVVGTVSNGKKTRKRSSNRNYCTSKKVREQQIVDYIHSMPKGATRIQVSKRFNISRPTADRYLHNLKVNNTLTSTKDAGRKAYKYFVTQDISAVPIKDEEVSTSERILQFVSDHYGEDYPLTYMAEMLNLAYNTMYVNLVRLKKRGLVPDKFNGLSKFANITITEVPAEPVVETVETPVDDPMEQTSERSSMLSDIEYLILQFIKDRRSTDVLEFLDYLEEMDK